MPPPVPPVRGYSFTSFQATNPTAPLPASNLDTEIDRSNQAIGQLITHISGVIRADGTLGAATVGQDQLQPDVFDGVVLPAEQRTNIAAAAAEASELASEQFRNQAQSFALQAQSSATNTQNNADTASSAAATAQTLRDEAQSFRNQAQTSASLAQTERTGAQLAANNAQNDRDLARKWASDMSGPVDDGLYSAKFYAIATLGYDPGAPGTVATQASLVAFSPFGGISGTNVQVALQELDAEKANLGHQHSAADITSGIFDIERLPVTLTGSPNPLKIVRADDARLSDARAPLAHNHAIADVTNLQTSLDAKANLNSPNFTGTPQISGSNIFHEGNFNPANYALLSSANFISLSVAGNAVWHAGNFNPALRQRIVSSPTALANNATIPSAESGLTYSMNLAGGVQIVNLPATTGLADGFSCVVIATGAPSGFQTASVRAEVGKTVSYRGSALRDFFLIGNGEVFRFTWLAALDTWVAECLRQPPVLANFGRFSNSSAWNSTNTAWTPVTNYMNTTYGASANFQLNSGAFQVAAAGIYECRASFFYSAGGGGGVTGVGSLIGGTASGTDSARGYTSQQFNVGTSDSGFVNVSWSEALAPGGTMSAWVISSVSGLWTFLTNNITNIQFLSR